ncbi:ComF family protein [Isoptericola aurantiacus]|uniref:ComF family protein n=1 Tax=Isoptericola aurantiacus TaxID=3377839 RepID=UPI003839DEE0
MLTLLNRLAVPVACPGCGRPDVPVCPGCAAAVAGDRPRRVEADAARLDRLDGVAPLPVWALADCAGGVRELIVAWKDRDRADLDGLLARAVRRAARTLAPALRPAVGPSLLRVVPAPSSPGARLRRGRETTGVLAAAVARGAGDAGLRAAVVPALRRRGRARDQVGLGARARGDNLARAVEVRAGRVPGGAVCLLVDDVLTTGATLAAAERVLEAAGCGVVGALVLAATPPPGTVTRSPRPGPSPGVHPGDTFGLV